MPPAARRTREIASTRDDILAAAERAFARTGYEATTMQDLAREAGYTVPSLYAYFDGKQELYDAVWSRLDDERAQVFDTIMPSGLRFSQRVEFMLARQLELTERRRGAVEIRMASPQRHGKRRATLFDGMVQRWARWLRRVAEPGDLGATSLDDAATALVGVMNAFFLRWMARDVATGLAVKAPLITELFLSGITGRRR